MRDGLKGWACSRGWALRLGLGVAALSVGFAVAWAGDSPPVSLGIPATNRAQEPLPAFVHLPPATRHAFATLSAAPGSRTIAILGDLAPANAASDKYLKQTVAQLNLLRPDAVFTVGNLVPGLTRGGDIYAAEATALCRQLDALQMPWFPCPGRTDVATGTPNPDDRRFEQLYQNYFGPLYYSTDCGAVHVIVLDSEEDAGARHAIGDAQLAWLKGDLNKTFESRGEKGHAQYVIVLLHRPLWRIAEKEGGNWDRVHEALVEFNRRPIVTVEGVDAGGAGGGGEAHGPRVVAVYAGSTGAYSLEPARDSIQYVVLGATAARIAEDASVDIRHFTLIKFDAPAPAATGDGVHAALVELGGGIVPADIITAAQRATLHKIAALSNDELGVIGSITQLAAKDAAAPPQFTGDLQLALCNPLEVPLDIELRLASARNLGAATDRENSNAFIESLDSPWEFETPYVARHLEPGAKEHYKITLRPTAARMAQDAPPQLEFVVHWGDERGRMHTIVLKRHIPVIPQLEVPIAALVVLDGVEGWHEASSGGTFAWNPRGDEPRKQSPTWEMTAMSETIFLRVHVADTVKSAWPVAGVRPGAADVPCDAVSVAWAASSDSPANSAERIWVIPFAKGGTELWTNTGVGEKQTALEQLDPKHGVKAAMHETDDGYSVTLALPRRLLMGMQTTCVLNIVVHDNDNGPTTWVRSWAKEEPGPAGWGRVSLTVPETQPATIPAAPKAAR